VFLFSESAYFTHILLFFILVKIIAFEISGKLAARPAGDILTWCTV
jgi:hypothetical protein